MSIYLIKCQSFSVNKRYGFYKTPFPILTFSCLFLLKKYWLGETPSLKFIKVHFFMDWSRSNEICLIMSKCQPNFQNINQIAKLSQYQMLCVSECVYCIFYDFSTLLYDCFWAWMGGEPSDLTHIGFCDSHCWMSQNGRKVWFNSFINHQSQNLHCN